MSNITYTVNQDTPQSIPNVEIFSQEDTTLANTFQINQLFDSTRHSVELHIYNLAGELLESEYNYTNYKELGNAASAGKEGASVLTIDPVADVELYEYDNGGVKLLYNFVDDLYTDSRETIEFFIDSISPDRTELRLKTFNLTPEEVLSFTNNIKAKLETLSYFNEFRVNFLNNDLFIGVNIDTLQEIDDTVVTVKLYEPLPDDIVEKSTLSIVELVSDSAVYGVTTTFTAQEEPTLELRSPNFNIDLIDESTIPTEYYNYDTLLSLPISNTTNELYSLVNSKGVQLSIDHNDYSNFVHFSSAQERLLNFKYKFDLIQSYNAQIASFQTVTTPSLGTTGSLAYYESLVKGIVNNFDHYERFLYYESGSNSWPKTNNTKPYINDTTSVGDTWFNNKQTVAATYDVTNTNILINSIPSYLRDDSSNASYITFIHMIAQHFDNMWVYAKGVSDKYNADNRLDFGVSRDLVAEVLKNFGVKLYTSNKSVEDLFSSFIGQPYQSGSEVINTYVTGSVTGSNASIQPSSFDNYQREVYKRMYHNLPLLLKSKGTERGLRALINCFGIPSDILDIKVYGGRNVNERPFYGDYRYYTSSLDKVRLDNTGSIVTGNTLSQYTSVVKREYKYTDDLHSIELGFSPTDNVDKYIESQQSCTRYRLINGSADPAYYSYVDCGGTLVSNQEIVGEDTVFINATAGTVNTGSYSVITATIDTAPTPFNIDDYLGDPRNLYSDNYNTFTPAGSISGSLVELTDQIMSGSDAYNVQDFVRLIKFFDNTIFKMVKDFIPARSTADTGIIIKPHILQRNKAKSVVLSGSRPEITGSIDTAFIEGGNGGVFKSVTQGKLGDELNTSYISNIQTPFGVGFDNRHTHQEASFDGELRNSSIRVTDGELNNENLFKTPTFFTNNFDINRWLNSEGLCILAPYGSYTDVNGGIYYSGSNNTLYLDSGSWSSNAIFTGLSQVSMVYEITSSNIPTGSYTFPFNTDNYANYSTHSLTASNTGVVEGICTSSINVQVAVCDIDQSGFFRSNIKEIDIYDVTSWFVTGSQNPSSNVTLNIINNTDPTTVYNGLLQDATEVNFGGNLNDTYTLTVQDTQIPLTCTFTYPIVAGLCSVVTSSLWATAAPEQGLARWSINEYLGVGSTTTFGTPNADNYGLARFFTGINPDNQEYRVVIYGPLGVGTVADVIVTPPNPTEITSSASGTFLAGEFALGIPQFQWEWYYGPTGNQLFPHEYIIPGRVALFKVRYSDQYLFNYPNIDPNSNGIFSQNLFIQVTALESNECTPFIRLRPPVIAYDEPEGINICCFTGDTLVTLADLTTKRIDEVRVGDKVLSYNEITNEEVTSTVVATTSPTKNNIAKFILSNGTVVEATTEHPFWEVNKGWSSYSPPETFRDHKMKVAKIEEGDTLLTQEGIEVQILSMELDLARGYEQVYNLKLEGHYTYYANGIVVHNEKPANEQDTCSYEGGLGDLFDFIP